MKNLKWIVALSVFLTMVVSQSFAHDWHHWRDASGDEKPKSFRHGMSKIDDGFKVFPGFEIGTGSGALSASVGVNVGYKYKMFFVGTSLKGQIVNIDHVNYQFMPATLNIMGLSYSVIPETTNSQNDKKLKGQSIGFGFGPKLSFSQLFETDPVTDAEREYLMISLGVGF